MKKVKDQKEILNNSGYKIINLIGYNGRYMISSNFEIYKRTKKGLIVIGLVTKKNESYYPIWRNKHLIKVNPDTLHRLWYSSVLINNSRDDFTVNRCLNIAKGCKHFVTSIKGENNMNYFKKGINKVIKSLIEFKVSDNPCRRGFAEQTGEIYSKKEDGEYDE